MQEQDGVSAASKHEDSEQYQTISESHIRRGSMAESKQSSKHKERRASHHLFSSIAFIASDPGHRSITKWQGTKQTMAKGKSPVKLTLESSSHAKGDNQYNKKALNSELATLATNLPGKQRQQGL